MNPNQTSIVFGVGPGLGWALASRFASEGLDVGAVARDGQKLDAAIQASSLSKAMRPYSADVSKPEDASAPTCRPRWPASRPAAASPPTPR